MESNQANQTGADAEVLRNENSRRATVVLLHQPRLTKSIAHDYPILANRALTPEKRGRREHPPPKGPAYSQQAQGQGEYDLRAKSSTEHHQEGPQPETRGLSLRQTLLFR